MQPHRFPAAFDPSRRRLLKAVLGGAVSLTASRIAFAASCLSDIAPAAFPRSMFAQPDCGGDVPEERRALVNRHVEEWHALKHVALPDLVSAGQPLTVSGISSGAAMAMQFHVAFSSRVKGAGLFAGPAFGCAVNGADRSAQSNDIWSRVNRALEQCMANRNPPSAETLAAYIDALAARGGIDAPSHLADARVWLQTGNADSVVAPGAVELVRRLYRHYVSGAQAVRFENRPGLAHAWPTADAATAHSCSHLGPPYVNACGYAGTAAMLAFLLDRAPRQDGGANLFRFRQRDFLDGLACDNMMSDGLVALPPRIDAQTRLHVAFHGCHQAAECLGTAFARETGLADAAAMFNLVVLMPQARANSGVNPKGCWDWWGYNEATTGSMFWAPAGDPVDFRFPTRCGDQMNPIRKMAQRIAGGSFGKNCAA